MPVTRAVTVAARVRASALVAALPVQVPVEVVLPARDPALLTVCRRAGLEVVDGSLSARGHVGGSLRVRRGGGAT